MISRWGVLYASLVFVAVIAGGCAYAWDIGRGDEMSIKVITATCMITAAFLLLIDLLPARRLVILDLNGIIVFRKFAPVIETEAPELLPFLASATLLDKTYTWTRPHAREFVEYLLDNFNVAIWSSAWPQNVELVVKHVFGDRRKELVFEWSQAETEKIVPHPDPAKTIPLFKKDLSMVAYRHPHLAHNGMIIIDDSHWKTMDNDPSQVLLVDSWEPHRGDGGLDTGLAPGKPIRNALERFKNTSFL